MKRIEPVRVYVTNGTRPAHDSAPFASINLTDDEASTLRSHISRYLNTCRTRRVREGRDANPANGDWRKG